MASSGFSYKPTKSVSISPNNAAQVGSFGEIMVAQLEPTAQGDFVYGINDKVFDIIGYSGGGAYQENGMAVVTSSTDPRGSGAVELRRALKYSPGQGSLFRGTAIFSEGTAGNVQLIGLGNGECGYFIGYLNQNFAILHQPTSVREIRKLTVTTPAAEEDITVTLDGITIDVPVVGGSDTTQTAYQLSLADYTQVGDGWNADVIGSDVYFLSARAGPYTGVYSATKAGDPPDPLGTFTQVSLGVAPSSTVILQSSWNLDKMDGTGPSRMVLDPQKGNIYQIGFQYLGQGEATFAIEDGKSGQLVPVHRIKNSNNRTTPVLRNPNVFGLVTSTNSGGTQNVEVRSSSMATFVEGKTIKLDPKFSYAKTFNTSNTSGFFQGLLALKINRVHQGKNCFGALEPLSITATNNAGSAAPKSFQIGIFVDSTITGDVNFQEVSSTTSIVSYADLGNGQAISPNLIPIFSFGVASGQGAIIDLEKLNFSFSTGRTIIVAFKAADAISSNSLTFDWFEKQ